MYRVSMKTTHAVMYLDSYKLMHDLPRANRNEWGPLHPLDILSNYQTTVLLIMSSSRTVSPPHRNAITEPQLIHY